MEAVGLYVVPHQQLAGFQGAWLFRRNESFILSVPPEEVDDVEALVKKKPPTVSTLFTPAYRKYLFEDRVQKVIGPAFQGFYQAAPGEAVNISKLVRRLNHEEHQESILALSHSDDPTGWNNSGVFKPNSILYGYYHQGKVSALASYRMLNEQVGFIGVYTHPDYRGQGFGQATVKAAIADLARQGKVALYQTLHSNLPAIGIAKNLGVQHFASHVAVRLNPLHSI